MTEDRNVIRRERLRAGVVECPVCGRQLPAPEEHLVVFGHTDTVGVATADAVECPVCEGVAFIVDEGSGPDG